MKEASSPPCSAELPLDATSIRAELGAASLAALGDLQVLESVDSTNSYLSERVNRVGGHFQAVFAECQLAGRGRLGRNWYSPRGGNIYLSVGKRLAVAPAPALSLAIGVGVAKALERHTDLAISLKWPNDIYVHGAKLGGVLIETVSGPHGVWMVLGVGINIRLADDDERTRSITQAWTDVERATGGFVERNRIAGALLDEIMKAAALFADKGFEAFSNDWAARDLVRGQDVTLSTGARVVTEGVAAGVDHEGALLVKTRGCGQVKRVMAGELSLRSARVPEIRNSHVPEARNR